MTPIIFPDYIPYLPEDKFSKLIFQQKLLWPMVLKDWCEDPQESTTFSGGLYGLPFSHLLSVEKKIFIGYAH